MDTSIDFPAHYKLSQQNFKQVLNILLFFLEESLGKLMIGAYYIVLNNQLIGYHF